MIEEISLRVTPKVASNQNEILKEVATKTGIPSGRINDVRIIKKSIDARKKDIFVNLTVRFATDDDKSALPPLQTIEFKRVTRESSKVIIVGAGPAGLFAALRCLEFGLCPIVLERGKDVDSRRIDITNLNRTGVVDSDSNYCFGEGGAGTFSDGKLFTRSKKRGDNEAVMQLLVQFGASPTILADSHPHIGSDRLPHIIKAIREKIIECGGEVKFRTKVEKLIIHTDNEGNRHVQGVVDAGGDKYFGKVILATGHSARDTVKSLYEQGVEMEPKGFAMGVRLEHPVGIIDRIQYHNAEGKGKYLPTAEYNFVTQINNRGVYSFCMCPGGVVVPAMSAPGEGVVNGMSSSARNGKWSNSGMVVEIRPGDFPEYKEKGVFELMELQHDLEEKFYMASGETLRVPAQRMIDFVNQKDSETLPKSSYAPGLIPARVDKLLPEFISGRLREGFAEFGRKSKGFLTNDAIVLGLESRTSSPIRIPRDKVTLSHSIQGLYPAGEGAGYAGGIISAAIDGRRCVDAIANTEINH